MFSGSWLHEGKIENAYDLIGAVAKAHARYGPKAPLWYRGVDRAGLPIQPSLYWKDQAHLESTLILWFQLNAEMRHSRCPGDDDYGRWLSLMQHYGLPTRLLDWTRSLFTAAHFAVSGKHPEEDGELLVLRPCLLNKRMARDARLFMLQSPLCREILERAFEVTPGEEEDVAYAVFPAHSDPRLVVQQSTFTLHGSGRPLETSPGHEEFLMRFVITVAGKKNIEHFLSVCGISQSQVFPDLQHLAADLCEATWNV